MNVRVLADAKAVARAAAGLFVAAANESVADKGTFAVALSGGSTPRRLYALLASDERLRADVPWPRCYFFFGDERHVPPDHPDSNYGMTYEALLSKVPVGPSQVFRIKGELESAERAAVEYEQAVRQFFELAPGQFPQLDLAMLGLGSDGHVASLFPGTRALEERARLVTANWVGELNAFRITMTLPVLNESARVMLLVQGSEKARTVKSVLEGDDDRRRLPAQLIRSRRGTTTWLIDRSAAALLRRYRDPGSAGC